MKFEPSKCPKCDSPAKSTLGSVLVDELMNYDEELNEYDYADDSDIDWNCQESEIDPTGRLRLSCSDCGDSWWAVHLDPSNDELEARKSKLGVVNIPVKMTVEGARLFLHQRRLLSSLLSADVIVAGDQYEQLEGLINLCDDIADCLADAGFPHCVMSRPENPDLAALSDDAFENLTDAMLKQLQQETPQAVTK